MCPLMYFQVMFVGHFVIAFWTFQKLVALMQTRNVLMENPFGYGAVFTVRALEWCVALVTSLMQNHVSFIGH